MSPASRRMRPSRRPLRSAWPCVAFALATFIACVAPFVAYAEVRVVASDARRVVLEVVPSAARTEVVRAGENEYIRLSIPGFGETAELGRPEIPVSSARIAVPPGATPRLRILEETWSSPRPGAVIPVAERIGVREPFGANRVIEREPQEAAAYAAAPLYPESPFELSGIAGLRHLRTVSVVFHGARALTSTRSYILLERVLLEVVFETDPEAPIRRTERPVAPDELWERTARGSVLNAQNARAWTRGGAGDGPLVGDAPWGPGDQWKIRVEATGLVAVSFATLAAAGFPAGVDIDDLALYQRTFDLGEVDDPSTPAPALFVKRPVPIRVNDGGVVGVFDGPDSFWFYGRSFEDQWMTSGREHEDLFGQDNFVWLAIDAAAASRMSTVRPGGSLSGSATDSLESTPHTVRVEQDTAYYERPPDFGPGTRAFEAEFYYRNNTQSPTTDDNGDPTGWILKSGGLPYDPFDVQDPVPGTDGALVIRVVGGGRPIDSNYTTRMTATINDAAPAIAQKTFYNGNLYSGSVVPPANVLHSFAVPAGVLAEGENRFSFRGESFVGNGTGSPFAVTRFFFDWFQVTYDRLLRAQNGRLTLSTSSGAAEVLLVRVSGFTGSDLALFDVTDPAAPAVVGVDPAQIVSDGPGGFALRFDHDNAVAPATYTVVRAGQVPTIPAGDVSRVGAPTILAGGAGVRYIAITADELLSGAQALAADRGARMTALAAPLSQIGDVFGNGMTHPRAMKAYMAYAFHRWTTPPAFLCLVGDASEDHRGVVAESEPDLVPSHSLWASYEGAPEETDQYFVEVTRGSPPDPDGFDDVSDLYVGRLAVNSLAELDWNLRRIQAYEDPGSVADDAWRRQVLLLADDAFSGDLGGGFGFDGYRYQPNEVTFRTFSDIYADSLEALPFDSLVIDKLYVSQFTMPCPDSCYTADTMDCENGLGRDCGIWYDCRNPSDWVAEYTCMRAAARAAVLPELLAKLSAGKFIWNFEGHANKYFMCHEEIFRDDTIGGRDIEAVRNEGKPFIFFGFACHLAEFDNADEALREDSVAEKLMNKQPAGTTEPGGAIGVFASSGFEFLGPNLGFNADVFEAFFHPERAMQTGTLPDTPGEGGVYSWTLGEATTRARLLYQNRYPWSPSNDQNRQAAMRFVLLGDPAVTPDIGGPEIRVTANGTPVADGQFLDVDTAAGPIEIVATIDHGRGVGAVRVVDSARGEVSPAEFSVAVADSTVDGVPRRKTVTYEHTQQSGSYDLVVQAANERGVVSDFTMSLRADLTILDVAPYPNPFENELRLYYRLTKRADDVRVRVFTVAGRRIFESSDASGEADVNQFSWDGRDDAGNPVANGTYLVHLRASGSAGDAEAVTRVVKMR